MEKLQWKGIRIQSNTSRMYLQWGSYLSVETAGNCPSRWVPSVVLRIKVDKQASRRGKKNQIVFSNLWLVKNNNLEKVGVKQIKGSSKIEQNHTWGGKEGQGDRGSREHLYFCHYFLKVILYLLPSWILRINLKVDSVIIPIPQMKKLSL